MGLRRCCRRHPRVQAAILVPLVGLLGFQTVKATQPWKDNLDLYTHVSEVAPESIIANEYLGGELLAQQRFADALPLFLKALNRFPPPGGLELYTLDEQIGQCYLGLGSSIRRRLTSGTRSRPTPACRTAMSFWGWSRARKGHLADAEAHLRHALQLRPESSPAYAQLRYYLGNVLEAKGDLKGALAEYEAALQENPDGDSVREHVVALRAKLGQPPP